MEYFEAVGRRKTATARVRLYPGGDGSIVVNDKPMPEYFVRGKDVMALMGPLQATATEHRFNISVKVKGGGITGQAEDIKIQAEEVLKDKKLINEILARHTGQPLERIEQETERDRYMTATEAKEYGLVDEILGEPEPAKNSKE